MKVIFRILDSSKQKGWVMENRYSIIQFNISSFSWFRFYYSNDILGPEYQKEITKISALNELISKRMNKWG